MAKSVYIIFLVAQGLETLHGITAAEDPKFSQPILLPHKATSWHMPDITTAISGGFHILYPTLVLSHAFCDDAFLYGRCSYVG